MAFLPGQEREASPFWRSRHGIGCLVLAGIAGWFTCLGGGFLLQWPTVRTLLMFPVLLIMYGRLALTEEAQVRAQFGDEFDRHAAGAPRFIPRTGQARRTA